LIAASTSRAQPNPAPIFAPRYRVNVFTPQPHPLGTKPPAVAPSGAFYRPFLPLDNRFRGMRQRGFHASWYFPFAWSSQFLGPMVRALVTPEIARETTYLYRVVATWLKDGKLTTEARQGPILPGELVVVDFRDLARDPPPPQPSPSPAPSTTP
jgi:hypothetical protein